VNLRCLGCVTLLSAFSGLPLARAQSAEAAAISLFDEAERLAAQGEYAAACPKYAESHRLDPQLGALLHLAACYEQTGRLASAWSAFRDAADLGRKRHDARAALALERAAALEPRLPRLAVVVNSSVPGIEVRRDGVQVGPAAWSVLLPVDPGEHVIEVSAPGRRIWRSTLTLQEGARATVEVPELAPASVPATHPRLEAARARPLEPALPRRAATAAVLPWLSLAAGVVAAGGGIAFEVSVRDKLRQRDAICPTGEGCTRDEQRRIDALTQEARRAARFETTCWVAGAALGVGSLVLWLTLPGGSRVSVSPAVSKTSYGVALTGPVR
jgi:hypothetical protein